MKACWMLCLVTALSASAAWAESPLQSLQFEQQKQQVLKAVKENAPRRAPSAIPISPIKSSPRKTTRVTFAKRRWRKSAIIKKAIWPPLIKFAARRNNGLNYQENRCHSKLSSPEFGTSPDSGFTSHEGVTLTVFLMNQYRRMLHISVHWRFNHDCKT